MLILKIQLLATVLLAAAATSEDTNIPCTHVFQATREWKVVGPDECLPKGLHVRINFDTGIKEAKLVSESENKDVVVLADQDSVADNDFTFVKETIPKQSNINERQDLIEQILGASLSLEQLVANLQFLEEELGEIDEGTAFMSSENLRTDLAVLFRHSSENVRIHSARVFASAVSNNKNAQHAALATLNPLLDALGNENTHAVRKSLLHAVTSLLRGNIDATGFFWRQNGFDLLYSVYLLDHELRVAVLSLLEDLFDKDLGGIGDSNVGENGSKEGATRLARAGFCAKELTADSDSLLRICLRSFSSY